MKKGILFVLAAAFLASCQQEENEGVASVDRVTITPIITRATEVNFEDQDQIGLSVTKEDGTVYANRCTDFIHRACRPDHQLRNLRLYGGKQIRRTSFGELHQHDLQAHADQTGY